MRGAQRHQNIHGAPRIERPAAMSPHMLTCGSSNWPKAWPKSWSCVCLRISRVNPGSVGCPGYRDSHPFPHVVEAGSPDARYAILEFVGDSWEVTFRHVPYDHDAMAGLARQNGQAELATAIATGWIT